MDEEHVFVSSSIEEGFKSWRSTGQRSAGQKRKEEEEEEASSAVFIVSAERNRWRNNYNRTVISTKIYQEDLSEHKNLAENKNNSGATKTAAAANSETFSSD